MTHAASGVAEAAIDAAALRRLRWRARRGLLENDIIITRFLDRHATTLEHDDWKALQGLLELDDNTLLDLLLGVAEPSGTQFDPVTMRVLRLLRNDQG